MGGQHIKVYVRARPLNQNERSSGSCSVVSTTDQTVTLRERGQDKLAKTFTFDRVFGCKSRQIDVYRNVVMPLLDEVLLGYNCTVFAYGQTGTGKTFTMEGESSDASLHWDQDPSMGIIPRTLSQLFDELRLLGCESTVRVSFLEMYNEELFDLLSPATDTTRLRLYEDSTRKGSCIINHLEEVIVHNKNEVFGILQRGSAKRQTAATLMNAHSSRSHTVFSVTVHIKENNVEGEELLKIGKLNLVDLAGSENIGRSGAVERRAREAGNINQSLLTLGRVITSLVEGTPHIPYRESKLTRLLQDSLGGKTKTSIIATISPAYCNVEETLSTLDYAHRAKKITNRPEINQKLTKTTVIKEYTAEIERLRRDLNATREQSGVYLASENYQQMMSQIEDQSREIVDKLGHIRALQQQLESFQSSFSELKDNLEERESQLKSTNDELEATKQSLEERSVQCDEQRHLVSVHAATERQLTDQASQLLSVAAVATKDLGAVHSALDRKRHVETETQTALALFRQQSEGALTTLQQLITQQSTSAETFFTSLSTRLQELNERQACHTQDLSSQVLQLSDGCGQQLQQLLLELQSQSSCQLKIVADMSEEMNQQRQKHTEWQRSVTDRLADMSTSSTQLLQQLHSHDELHQQETTQLLSALSAALRDDLSGVRTGAELLSSKHEQWREKRAESESERRRQKEENRAVLADAEQSVEKRLQQVQSRVQQLNSELQLLSSEVASSRSAGDRLLAVVEEHNDQQCQESGLVAGFVDGCVETVQEALKHADASLTEHQRRAEQNCQNFVTRNSDLVQEVSECLKSADADVQTSLESQQASNSDHVRSMETQLERLGQSITADSTSTQNALNTTVDTLHRSCESARETLGEYGRRAGEAVGEMEKAGCDQADSGQDLQRKQETAVRDVRQLVNRLVEEQVLADVPSGATPQRRNLSFPRYLAATSPHERILQRHRNNLTTATKLSQQQQTDVDECSPTEFALPVAVPSEGAASEVLVQEPQEPQPASLSRSSSTVSVSSDMENQHPAAGSQAGKAVIPRPKRHTRATAASANPEVAQKRILQQHN